MKVFQQTQVTYDPNQSPRAYAEEWFRAYAEERLEEPADELLRASASGYGDMVLVDHDVTWKQITEECGGEFVLVSIGEHALLWTEPSPEDEQALHNKTDYDEDGYDICGFDTDWLHRNGTHYDDDGYDYEGRRREDKPEPLPDELAVYDPPYSWCETVEDHKRNGRYDEALTILDGCIQVEEFHGGGVAPWYYEQSAIIHRKRRDRASELAVLRRFARQPHAAGAKPPKLLERLTQLEAADS